MLEKSYVINATMSVSIVNYSLSSDDEEKDSGIEASNPSFAASVITSTPKKRNTENVDESMTNYATPVLRDLPTVNEDYEVCNNYVTSTTIDSEEENITNWLVQSGDHYKKKEGFESYHLEKRSLFFVKVLSTYFFRIHKTPEKATE